MKRINSLFLLLFISIMTFAQNEPINRTAKTIVIDALASLPTKNESEHTKLMNDLVSTGSEGVALLADMFDNINNEPVNFAFYGWANFVMKEHNLSHQNTFVSALLKEIQDCQNREVKRFYISLLRFCGNDEAVPVLSSLLDDSVFALPAIEALTDINTNKAKDALKDAMTSTNYKEQMALAVGETELDGQEDLLISWLDGADDPLAKSVSFALSVVGTEKSVPVLWNCVKQANYTFSNNSVTYNYVKLLKRLSASNSKLALKYAKQLAKAAEKSQIIQTNIAAQSLIFSIDKAHQPKNILKAMKNDCVRFRCAILDYASSIQNAEVDEVLMKNLSKLSEDAQVNVADYFGQNNMKESLSVLMPLLKSSNLNVRLAALRNVSLLGDNQETVQGMVETFKNSSSEQEIAAAKEAISTFSAATNISDFDAILSDALSSSNSDVQIATVELLKNRRAVSQADKIFNLLTSSNSQLQTKAYEALPYVVSASHQSKILGLLVNASSDRVQYLQDALVNSLYSLPKSQQMDQVLNMMSKNASHENLFYYVLAKLCIPSALDTIFKSFYSGNEETKLFALVALNEWNGREIMQRLSPVLYSSTGKVKDAAIDCYLNQIAKQETTDENVRLWVTNVLEVAQQDTHKVKALKLLAHSNSYLSLITAGRYMENNSPVVTEAACQAVMKLALGNKNFVGKEVISLLKTCRVKLNNPDADYERAGIDRRLSQLTDEAGYVSIFNGQDLTGWKGLVGNPLTRAKMSASTLAKKQKQADAKMNESWSVKNGCIVFDGQGENLCTVKKYGDFELLLDWKLSKESTAADAGIYLRGNPQVQIWDINRKDVDAKVGSGGLYNNKNNTSKPLEVADNPLGEWNTFYIKMVGERVTVKLNGVKVVDNIIMENYWDSNLPLFIKEQIELQAHGSKVEYRNLYIKELKGVEPIQLSAKEKKEGFFLLFDGVSLAHWGGRTEAYEAKDGILTFNPKVEKYGRIYAKHPKEIFGDYIFRFEFNVTEGANNGIGIRATHVSKDPAYHGIELQILDNSAKIYDNLEVYQYHGSVYGVIPAKKIEIKPGQWYSQEVVVKGNHIKVTVNGQVIVDGNIATASKNFTSTMDHKDHPGLSNKKGYLVLLGHNSKVSFRNIRVKVLD